MLIFLIQLESKENSFGYCHILSVFPFVVSVKWLKLDWTLLTIIVLKKWMLKCLISPKTTISRVLLSTERSGNRFTFYVTIYSDNGRIWDDSYQNYN